MSAIYVSIVIDATPAEVWAVVEPIEHHVDWMADAVAIRFEGDCTRGVGTRFVCDTRIGPVRLADHMEITSWVAEREMGVTHRGLVTGVGKFTLTPAADGGTLFAWEEDLRFPWFLGRRLGELVGGQVVLRAVWRRNLRTLKRLVEQRNLGAPAARA
jgi:uncharacterized protein YndB with AHSA1/START domain